MEWMRQKRRLEFSSTFFYAEGGYLKMPLIALISAHESIYENTNACHFTKVHFLTASPTEHCHSQCHQSNGQHQAVCYCRCTSLAGTAGIPLPDRSCQCPGGHTSGCRTQVLRRQHTSGESAWACRPPPGEQPWRPSALPPGPTADTAGPSVLVTHTHTCPEQDESTDPASRGGSTCAADTAYLHFG